MAFNATVYRSVAKVQVITPEKIYSHEDIENSITAIHTHKNLGEPAGRWELVLTPDRDENGLTWYHKISVGNYVEIRMARDYERVSDPPVVMRGFVDNIRYSLRMGNDGRPSRHIVVNGQDYGMLFLISKIFYLKQMNPITKIVEGVLLQEHFGIDIDEYDPEDLMEKIFSGIILPQFNKTRLKGSKDFRYDSSLEINYGKIHTLGVQGIEGNVWSLMTKFDNAPWNELFTEEFEDATYLRFRVTPFKDAMGTLIQGEVDELEIALSDIAAADGINLGRSINEMANYFFVYPVQLIGNDMSFKAVTAGMYPEGHDIPRLLRKDGGKSTVEDKMADMGRFGFRPYGSGLSTNTSGISTEYMPVRKGKSYEKSSQLQDDHIALARKLVNVLVKAFAPNGYWESGDMTIKGNANAKIGTYLVLRQGSDSISFYIQGVSHSYIAGDTTSFSTSLRLVRGDGYIKSVYNKKVNSVYDALFQLRGNK